MDETRSGKLILRSIPTEEAEEMVVAFLLRFVKNITVEQMAEKVKHTPYVLSSNIAEEKGRKIAINLKEMGAIAEFEPHKHEPEFDQYTPEAEVESPAPVVEAFRTPVTTDFIQSELGSPRLAKPKPDLAQERPPTNSSKRLATALVSALLIVGLAMLAWQLFRILTP
jgi:hypothetical protein